MDIQISTPYQVLIFVAVSLLLTSLGWLATTVIALKADVQSLQSQVDNNDTDNNRRFSSIETSLTSISNKLDRLIERDHN